MLTAFSARCSLDCGGHPVFSCLNLTVIIPIWCATTFCLIKRVRWVLVAWKLWNKTCFLPIYRVYRLPSRSLLYLLSWYNFSKVFTQMCKKCYWEPCQVLNQRLSSQKTQCLQQTRLHHYSTSCSECSVWRGIFQTYFLKRKRRTIRKRDRLTKLQFIGVRWSFFTCTVGFIQQNVIFKFVNLTRWRDLEMQAKYRWTVITNLTFVHVVIKIVFKRTSLTNLMCYKIGSRVLNTFK